MAAQRQHVITGNYAALLTPSEDVYQVANPETAAKLQLSS